MSDDKSLNPEEQANRDDTLNTEESLSADEKAYFAVDDESEVTHSSNQAVESASATIDQIRTQI